MVSRANFAFANLLIPGVLCSDFCGLHLIAKTIKAMASVEKI